MDSFTENLKKNGFKKIYIISGEEEYIRQKAIKALIGAFAFAMPELNHSVLDGRAKASDIINACETLPLLDEKRLVQVKDFEPFKSKKTGGEGGDREPAGKTDTSKLEEYLAILPETTVLLFDSEGKVDKRRKLYKQAEKSGVVLEYGKMKPQELTRAVCEEAALRGLKLSPALAEALIEKTGQDLYALTGELDKFASFAQDGKVTKADIDLFASRSLEYDVFSLHELFMQGHPGPALALLNQVVEAEKSPFGVIGLIAYKFRLMLKARAMIDAKFPKDSMIGHLGVHPNVARTAIEECRRFSAEELRNALKALSDLDYRLKSGQGGRYLTEKVFLQVYKAE
jgi:DNA polymerase-3 subunit delta